MNALLRRFVQRLADRMIGHTIPEALGKNIQNGFYTSWLSTGKGARRPVVGQFGFPQESYRG
jgi:hypothetical protein